MTIWSFLLQFLLQVAAQTLAVCNLPVFWCAVLILAIQSWMQQTGRYTLWGTPAWNNYKQTAYPLSVFLSRCMGVLQVILPVILMGWLGGIFASTLLIVFGITLHVQILVQLWMITFIFLFMGKRYVCFAYAGGIVALGQYWLYGDGVVGQQVLMLVAILHLTEAILVRICGPLQAVPVYLRDKTGKTTTGAYMQITWPLPLAVPELLGTETQSIALQAGYLSMPDWWPVFALSADSAELAVLYQLIPMLAAIGYSDRTGDNARERTRAVCDWLLAYSLLLGILVLLCFKTPGLICVAALFSIIGHEVIARR